MAGSRGGMLRFGVSHLPSSSGWVTASSSLSRLLRQTCLHWGGCTTCGSGDGRGFLNSLLDSTHWHVPESQQRSWICHALGCHPVSQETFWAVSWSCRAALRSFKKSLSGFSDHKAVQACFQLRFLTQKLTWTLSLLGLDISSFSLEQKTQLLSFLLFHGQTQCKQSNRELHRTCCSPAGQRRTVLASVWAVGLERWG